MFREYICDTSWWRMLSLSCWSQGCLLHALSAASWMLATHAGQPMGHAALCCAVLCCAVLHILQSLLMWCSRPALLP
jgi:hypothetical protein